MSLEKTELWSPNGLRMRLVGPNLEPEARIIETATPFARVGRYPGLEVQLEHADVSRWHVYLQRIDDGVFFFDLGSRLGVAYDGKTVRRGWFRDDKPLIVGEYELWLDGPAIPSTNDPAQRANDPATLVPVTLVANVGGREFPRLLTRALTMVGRDAPSNLQLAGVQLARVQFAFYRTATAAWCINVAQAGGECNDAEFVVVLLKEGDVVKGFDTTFTVRFSGSLPQDLGGQGEVEVALDDPVAKERQAASKMVADLESELRRLVPDDAVELPTNLGAVEKTVRKRTQQIAAMVERLRRELKSARHERDMSLKLLQDLQRAVTAKSGVEDRLSRDVSQATQVAQKMRREREALEQEVKRLKHVLNDVDNDSGIATLSNDPEGWHLDTSDSTPWMDLDPGSLPVPATPGKHVMETEPINRPHLAATEHLLDQSTEHDKHLWPKQVIFWALVTVVPIILFLVLFHLMSPRGQSTP